MAEQLEAAGVRVFEALSVSEVLHLCEHHEIDVVIVAPEIEEPDLVDVQLRRATMKLKPGAKAAEVVWELSNLFPSRPSTLQ